MSYTFDDVKTEISDRIGNSYFSDGNSNEVLRAVNHALRDINSGKTGKEPPSRLVGYEFQRETSNLTYVSGTVRYALSTPITSLAVLKWVDNVLINSDENVTFTKRDPSYFRRRRGVNNSQERMFAIESLSGTKYILVYHAESDTLNLIWYSTYLVASSAGTRAPSLPTTGNSSYTFLIPDEYMDCVIDLACAYLYLQDRNEQSGSSKLFLDTGRSTLQNMINTIGQFEKKPVNQLNVRSEWGIYDGNNR